MEFYKTFDAQIEQERLRWNLPSISYGVVVQGNVIHEGFFGYQDLENKVVPNRTTCYQIASMSKAFTALDIMMMVQDGKLKTTDLVKKHLRDFKLSDPMVTRQVNIKDLLCHRTGITRHDEEWVNEAYTKDELIDLLAHLPIDDPLGTKWNYQNLTYVVLGEIIERISHMPYHEFTSINIFGRLDMADTGFFLEDMKQKNYAKPYEIRKDGFKEITFFQQETECKEKNIPVSYAAAGGIYSNIKDLEKWMLFQLNRQDLLDERLLNEMHSPQIFIEDLQEIPCEEIELEAYGMGWFVDLYRETLIVHHGGNVPGYHSLCLFVPSLDLGVTILINKTNTLFSYALAYTLIDHYLGQENGDWFNRHKAFEESKED